MVNANTIIFSLPYQVAGVIGFAAIWGSQTYFGESKGPLWVFMGMGAALGFLGYLIVKRDQRDRETWSRACPICNQNMGVPRGWHAFHWKRAKNKDNRLDLQTRWEWVERSSDSPGFWGRFIETYYLCESCDREFRLDQVGEPVSKSSNGY